MTEHRTVALFGTPCGGTTFMSAACKRVGLDVGHEHPGADGIACGWMMWSASRWARGAFTFDHEWRIYRDPLCVLETLPAYVGPRLLGEVPPPWAHHDVRIAALRRWVLTHELLEQGPEQTIRIGPGFGADWARFCNVLRRPVAPLDGIERQSKPNRWPRPTWAELAAMDPEYAERARELVWRFA